MDMIIHKKGSLIGRNVYDFESDAIRIQSNGFASVEYCGITDTLATDEAHRDAIQLIPVNDGPRSQLAAAMMRNAIVENNTIESQGKLQGIFSSDGCYQNLTIRNNIIETNSQWKASINGFLSGWIDNNVDSEGNLVHVNLDNLRVGGNGIGENVYILDFADGYFYDKLENITSVIGPHITDNRGKIAKTNDIYIRNFRYDEFREKSLDVYDENAQNHGYLLQVLAMKCGDVVYE